MFFSTTHVNRNLLSVGDVFLILILAITIDSLQTAYGAEFEALNETALLSLGKHLTAMEKLAPLLRTQLRSERTSMKFDVREVHNIEISLEKAQSDIEHLIVMHNTDRVSPLRARFLVDDLRRKAATLGQGLSHVTQRLEKKYARSQQGEDGARAYSDADSQLLSLLQDYNRLVNQSLQLFSGAAK